MLDQTAAQPTIVEFWRRSRLRSDAVHRHPNRSAPTAPSILCRALRAAYHPRLRSPLAGECYQQIGRTLPSAGSLYPFDIVALVSTPDRCGQAFLYSVSDGKLVPLQSRSGYQEWLRTALRVTNDGGEVPIAVVVMVHPWLSAMRYGERGIFYAFLDVGHAAANIALALKSFGLQAVVHARFCHAATVAFLGQDKFCREPVAVVTAYGDEALGSPAAESDIGPAAASPPFGTPGADERAYWNHLQSLGIIGNSFDASDAACPLTLRPPRRGNIGSPLSSVRLPPAPPLSGPSFAQFADCRESARGFADGALSTKRFTAALAAIGRRLTDDCGGGPATAVTVRMVVRNLPGMSGVFAYDPQVHCFDLVGEAPPHISFRQTCMRQNVVEHAVALILLCASAHTALSARDGAALREMHIRAGIVGQLLYLGCAQHGIGVTGIGGFDERLCAKLGLVEPPDEVIYVVAVGLADAAARDKEDRHLDAFHHRRSGSLTRAQF